MVLPFKPQKTIVYNKHLPYRYSLDEEALKNLAEIKYNLSRAVLFQELVPGALIWFNRLDKYVQVLKINFKVKVFFSPEDQIRIGFIR